MTDPAVPAGRRHVPARRPSLSRTVLRLGATALVAAVLVWSVLFVDALRKHSGAGAAPPQRGDQGSGQDDGRSVEAPAPVTTRSS